MNIASLIKNAAEHGIFLSVEDGQLKFKLTTATFDDQIKQQIITHKPAIIECLTASQGVEQRSVRQKVTKREDLSAPVPASFGQQRLWFIDKLQGGSVEYNTVEALEVTGDFNVDVAQQAIKAIIERHQPLRTVYGASGDNTVQIIRDQFDFTLEQFDLSNEAENVKPLLSELSLKPFDLSADLMIRASFIQLESDKGLLLFNLHHIACDGWSMMVFVSEFVDLYQAILQDKGYALPLLAIDYADFSHWQRKWLTGDVLANQLDYWKTQLAQMPSVHTLPLAHNRPKMKQHQGAVVVSHLDAKVATRFQQIAKANQLTPFMLLHAMLSLVLSRHSNSADIVVGTAVANRMQAELEDLIGFFVNTLVLRTNTNQPTLGDYLAHVRTVNLEAQANQDVPFEQLVEHCKVPRSTSHTPLFQILFSMNTVETSSLDLPGLTFKPYENGDIVAKFDLDINAHIGEQGLELSWVYDTSLFEQAQVTALSDHLNQLLCNLVEIDQPLAGLKLNQLKMLSNNQAQRLLNQRYALPITPPKGTLVHQLIDEQAERTPDAIAVVYQQQQLTYSELNQKANCLAHHLKVCGLVSQDMVGICVQPGLETMISILAVLKADGVYVPLDPSYPDGRLQYMIEDCGIKLILSQSNLQKSSSGVNWIAVDEVDLAAYQSLKPLAYSQDPDALLYTIYTSGSTGQPKGAQVRHRNALNLLQWYGEIYQFNQHSNSLIISSLSFDLTQKNLFATLIGGGTLCFAPTRHFDPALYRQIINQQNITHLNCAPSAIYAITEDGQTWPDIDWMILGGEPIEPAWTQRWVNHQGKKPALINTYGPTECTDTVSSFAMTEDYWQANRCMPIGKTIPNVSLYVLDQQQAFVPYGRVGELCIGGASVGAGYYGNETLNQDAFIDDPFSTEPGAKLYRTGDLVRYLTDENLMYLGRIDHQLKVRGFRIEPGEIEQQMAQCDGVAATLVNVKDQHLLVYVEKQPDCKKTDSQLRKILAKQLGKNLPAHMVPNEFIFVTHWPLTPNGKIDKSALPQPDPAALGKTYVAAQTDSEEQLVRIWAKLLKRDPDSISVTADFFELGGHSLMAVRMVGQIRTHMNHEVAIEAIFTSSTIRTLAEHIDISLSAPLRSAVTAGIRLTDVPLACSYAQQRLWFLDQLDPDSAQYNISSALQVEGNFDVSIAEQAISMIIKRHDTLRTVYESDGQNPVQLIRQNFEFALQQVDLTEQTEQQQHSQINDIVEQDCHKPFDLAYDLMLRATFIELDKNSRGILALSLHHIAADGWSMGLLLEEFAACYRAVSESVKPDLPELNIQYTDFARWQRDWLSGEVLEQQLDYWRNQLQNVPACHNLLLDNPRSKDNHNKGALVKSRISPDIATQLQQLATDHQLTPFMLLHAGLAQVLSRHSNSSDIVIGTTSANRMQTELEPLIGCFVNSLVLRTNTDADDLSGFLSHVRQVNLEAQAHQDIPFEQLVEQTKVARSTLHTPLYQIMFNVNNTEQNSLSLPGLSFKPLDGAEGIAKLDLEVSARISETGIEFSWVYDSSLFTHKRIETLSEHLNNLLTDMLKNKSVDLKVMSGQQIHHLTKELNDTTINVDRNVGIHQVFEAQAEQTPDNIALVFDHPDKGEQQLTYRELNQAANRMAHYLQGQGVIAGAMVGICVDRSIDMVVGLLATLKAGGTYLPLDPAYPVGRLQHMMHDSGCSVLITQSNIAGFLTDLLPSTTLYIDKLSTVLCADHNPDAADFDASQLAYMIYTSGSTGKPKGVMVEHRNVTNLFAGLDKTIGSDEQQNWLALTSISFDISVLELFYTLCRGHKVVVAPERATPTAANQALDFSLFYFAAEEPTGNNQYGLLLEGAKFADYHDFAGVWVPERHFNSFGAAFPNPSVAAAAVAATTDNIKIRSGSVVLPLHDPIRVAEEWSMVDNLSNGRVELALASGWHPNDFVFGTCDYQLRHQDMREKQRTLNALWQGQSITRTNGIGNEVSLTVHPSPVQAKLTQWITTGGSPTSFEYAGSIGANVLTHLLGQSKSELQENIRLYRKALTDSGFDADKGQVALMLHTFIGQDMDFVKKTVEEPFKNYLRHSVGLIQPFANELGLDIDEHFEVIVDMAYQRYIDDCGLIGTPQSVMAQVESLQKCGVNDFACLIDFGIEHELVLDGLKLLNVVKNNVKQQQLQQHYLRQKVAQLAKAPTLEQTLVNHQISHLQCTPSYARVLVDVLGEIEHNLTTICVGGEALPQDLATQLTAIDNLSLYNMYGPTETTVWSSVGKITSGNVTINRPLANTQFYVVNNNRLTPKGVPGELYIGGYGVTRGYFERIELTADKFVTNPFTGGDDILYKTGDLVRYLDNGQLEFLGRIDEQVKLRGCRIELGEVQNKLSECDQVVDCAVVARPEGLFGYVKVADDCMMDEQTLSQNCIAQLKQTLPDYMLPSAIVVMDKFPQTPNGKVDKNALPMPGEAATKMHYQAAQTEVEQTLVAIWADLLEIDSDSISVNANFFDLGGHSLLVIRMAGEIRARLQQDLAIGVIFEASTIQTLAGQLTFAQSRETAVQQAEQGENMLEMEI